MNGWTPAADHHQPEREDREGDPFPATQHGCRTSGIFMTVHHLVHAPRARTVVLHLEIVGSTLWKSATAILT